MSQTSQAAGGTEPGALAGVQIQRFSTAKTKVRARRLLARHHYLGDVRAVGEQIFCAAHGWQELGANDGFGRVCRDLYVEHHKPERLFARELCPNARRRLAANQIKPALAGVEAKTRPRRSVHSCNTARASPTTARASVFIGLNRGWSG